MEPEVLSDDQQRVAPLVPISANVLRPIPAKRRGPIIISVEAAIGTGKSSLLRVLQARQPSWIFVQEPVELWQNVEGHNLLGAFYENLERFAFSFQTYCVLSHIEVTTAALERCRETNAPVMVLERCWHSYRHTFANMLFKKGKMNEMEWTLYDKWYNYAVRNSPTIHGHVFLDCSVKTCMNRLHKRSRTEEEGVTEEYQNSLIQHHLDWFNTLEQTKLCHICVDDDFLSNEKFCKDVVTRVSAFIDTLRRSQASA